jgi:predicted ATP-dependent endonuclease of OLD family
MKITNIQVKNFRLLKDFSLDLEDDLSLVLGKNNTGKTSLLSALDKFLNPSEKNFILFDDFNTDLRSELVAIINGSAPVPDEDVFKPFGISLKLLIEYVPSDNLEQVSLLIMNLDPDDNCINLSFDFLIDRTQLLSMTGEYLKSKAKFDNDPTVFLRENYSQFFGPLSVKSVSNKAPYNETDLTKERLSLAEVISFKSISAKRSVTNKGNDKTLSTQTATIYKKTSETQEQTEAVEAFKKQLRTTDKDLSAIYETMFAGVLGKVAKFGGAPLAETHIKIASTLQHRELLDGNTTVMYTQDDHELPEHFNGLGYMNLISMIFEIEMLMTSLRKSIKERPSAINILFIEEPEAHTHPQLQYIFIKNIKSLLKEGRIRDDSLEIHLQTIISTHSSHIVAECEFDDIKYLRRLAGGNSVVAKNLNSLKAEYVAADGVNAAVVDQHYRFLKQYLTLNRAELFFADKAVLVEGETERILLPAMMRKIDQESDVEDVTPLLSQNISLVEVGAYSQIFEKFIHFIGLKCLVLTDIDTAYTVDTGEFYQNGKPKKETIKCAANDALADRTSNYSLTFFHGKEVTELNYFLSLSIEQKVLKKKDGVWQIDKDGLLLLAYQTHDGEYHGRSFEDAFFSINKGFLGTDPEKFPSLVPSWFEKYVAGKCTPFEFAERAVRKKPSLAIEILLNSAANGGSEFSNWKIPAYIQEGLEWLRK